MKKLVFRAMILALAVVGSISTIGCNKEDQPCNECHCQTSNPLSDLGWLRAKVAELETPGCAMSMEISTCKYQTDKDGFFFSEEQCYDGQQYLYDCSGNLLCTMGGIAGKRDTVYNVDYSSLQLIYRNFTEDGVVTPVTLDNSDVLSGTKWMFVRHDDAPVNYMYVKMTFTEDGNIQMPFLTLPYVENGSAISVSYPESTRSHRFILSNDGQSLKILDNFHIFSDTQDIWDTTYFERRN